jgi:hypothetical protein
MRKNSLVCGKIGEINEYDDWTAIVTLVRYKELPDLPEFQNQKIFEQEILLDLTDKI